MLEGTDQRTSFLHNSNDWNDINANVDGHDDNKIVLEEWMHTDASKAVVMTGDS